MKRGKKLLTMLLALAVILGATYAATLLNPENEAEEETSATIFTVNADEVTGIRWDYSEPLSFTKENDAWVYDEDAAFPADETFLDTMLAEVKEITASKTIEAVEDWDQYTLEVPICEVTLTAGEDAYTIKIGEETSLGGERYLSIGDGNAYLVDADILDAFCYGLYDVLAYETVPEMETITAMEHTGKDSYRIDYLENSGLAYSDEYVWFIGEKPLDTELTDRLMTYVTDSTWQSCANYNAEDLSQYGLDDPAATITMYYLEDDTEKTYTLEIGAQAEDGYYARIQGSGMVYTLSDSVAETLVYTTYEELQPDEVLLMDWDEVKSMEITLDGETYKISRTTETVTDDEGNETEEVVYKLGGVEVDAASIPEVLDELESTGYANGLTPERSEEIRFVFNRERDTFPEVELAFCQYNSTSCLVTLNGEATVFVAREDVVDLVETVNALVLK